MKLIITMTICVILTTLGIVFSKYLFIGIVLTLLIAYVVLPILNFSKKIDADSRREKTIQEVRNLPYF